MDHKLCIDCSRKATDSTQVPHGHPAEPLRTPPGQVDGASCIRHRQHRSHTGEKSVHRQYEQRQIDGRSKGSINYWTCDTTPRPRKVRCVLELLHPEYNRAATTSCYVGRVELVQGRESNERFLAAILRIPLLHVILISSLISRTHPVPPAKAELSFLCHTGTAVSIVTSSSSRPIVHFFVHFWQVLVTYPKIIIHGLREVHWAVQKPCPSHPFPSPLQYLSTCFSRFHLMSDHYIFPFSLAFLMLPSCTSKP